MKPKTKVYTVTQQKGGTGKTTTAHAIAAGLNRIKGNKALLIDLDPQGNLTYTLAADTGKSGSLELLARKATAAEVIQHTPAGDIITAGQMLATIDQLLTQTGKEHRLAEMLKPIKDEYTHIIIDTPPALGTLTINALTAADSVIIPCTADAYSLQATGQIAETIKTVKQYCNPRLEIAGILITRYNPRQVITRDITELLEQAAAALETKVFNTRIREAVAIREAEASQQDIFSYAPKSNATTDYKNLIKELSK